MFPDTVKRLSRTIPMRVRKNSRWAERYWRWISQVAMGQAPTKKDRRGSRPFRLRGVAQPASIL